MNEEIIDKETAEKIYKQLKEAIFFSKKKWKFELNVDPLESNAWKNLSFLLSNNKKRHFCTPIDEFDFEEFQDKTPPEMMDDTFIFLSEKLEEIEDEVLKNDLKKCLELFRLRFK